MRRHGETSAIIEVFTAAHGRHAGVVRGGAGRRMGPVLQPGAQLDLTWRARLEEHLGSFTVEPLQNRAAILMGDRLALSGLNAVVALLLFALPERAPFPALYRATVALLDLLGRSDDWGFAYLRWELLLLSELGFGLDLGSCAVTGVKEGLCHVSPRSGRAVSVAGAGAWASRLLPLPLCLQGAPDDMAGLCEGLRTTGYFLQHRMAAAMGNKPLPAARHRLVEGFLRCAGLSAAPR